MARSARGGERLSQLFDEESKSWISVVLVAALAFASAACGSEAKVGGDVRGAKADEIEGAREFWSSEETVRSAYLSSSNLTEYDTPEWKERFERWKDASINAVVVDIKEHDGAIRFVTRNQPAMLEAWDDALEALLQANTYREAVDLQDVVEFLKGYGFRVVLRHVVFKDERLVADDTRLKEADPSYELQYAVVDRRTGNAWGSKSKAWINAYSAKAADYNVEIALRGLHSGAHEVQFDYIRFAASPDEVRKYARYPGRPSEGEPGHHPWEAIANFLKYAEAEIHARFPQVKIGIAVFDYVANGWDVKDGLGQHVSMMAEYSDVIWPMYYPSHWGGVYNGVANRVLGTVHPETIPEAVYCEAIVGLRQQLKDYGVEAEIRPWVQVFRMKEFIRIKQREPRSGQLASYTVRQINGIIEGGGDGFALWGDTDRSDYGQAIDGVRAAVEGQTVQQIMAREPGHPVHASPIVADHRRCDAKKFRYWE
jgi:hypothetical protein